MPDYADITLKEMFDTVLLRSGRHRNEENFDWTSVCLLINRAIREAVINTLPYKDWAYIEQFNVANGTVLPWRYLKYVRALLSSDGEPPYYEARYVDPAEYFTMTNWYKAHSWNRSRKEEPVFTVWGSGASLTEPSQATIYISPNTDYQTGTAPTGYSYYEDDYSGILEFNGVPPDLTLPSEGLPVPYEYTELVTLGTLARLYARTGESDLLKDTQKKIFSERTRLVELFRAKRMTEQREIVSYTEPVPPFQEGYREEVAK